MDNEKLSYEEMVKNAVETSKRLHGNGKQNMSKVEESIMKMKAFRLEFPRKNQRVRIEIVDGISTTYTGKGFLRLV
jgi:tyrosine-protein phosphatase YwqE